MSTEAIEAVVNKLRSLPAERQSLAVSYIESLSALAMKPKPSDGITSTAGCLSPEDADAMEAAIEEAFEQIHPDDWKDLPRF